MARETRPRRVSIGYNRKPKELIVEFPGGMIHLTTGLSNRFGQEVSAVSVEVNGDRYAGDPEYWAVSGTPDAKGVGLRILKGGTKNAPEYTEPKASA